MHWLKKLTNNKKKPTNKAKSNTAAAAKKQSSSTAKKPTIKADKKPFINIQQFSNSKDKPNKSNIGKVYWGKTKYIDNDSKPRRRYLVVKENEDKVKVAKLVSIKQLDEKGNNTNKNVVEIKNTYPGLTKRTGAFKKLFGKNKVTKDNLSLSDNNVFTKQSIFKLDDEDFNKVQKNISNDKTEKRKKSRLKKKA